jgi:hypothetical protein
MQASRIIRVAADLLKDYERFKIPDFLAEAINIANVRGDINQYRPRSAKLKFQADEIIGKTIIRSYPEELRRVLEQSAYATAAPARLSAGYTGHGGRGGRSAMVATRIGRGDL